MYPVTNELSYHLPTTYHWSFCWVDLDLWLEKGCFDESVSLEYIDWSKVERVGIGWLWEETLGVDWLRVETLGVDWLRVDTSKTGWLKVEIVGVDCTRDAVLCGMLFEDADDWPSFEKLYLSSVLKSWKK